ncbi:MAG: glycosyltransferase family 4 protein [Anaerolineales bacterium]
MNIAFVTNFCPYYRVRTFETLAKYHNVDYFFYSAGNEWYWQQQHGIRSGNFHYEYLRGLSVGRTRITPDLPGKLLRGGYDVYIKCINGRFALPITYLIARIRNKPFILWTGIWMRLMTPSHRLIFPATRFIYRNADAVVVYGEHVKRYLISEGVSEERIFVASHSVDNNVYNRAVTEEERAALKQKLNIPEEKKIILYLGRLEEAKGLSYLLDAFASLKREDCILVFAGNGKYRHQLEERAVEKDIIAQIRFAGYVQPEQATVYYADANVFVLPSITTKTTKETWGLVVNEAFNQGLPVIATDAVGAAAGGFIKDGINGYIVKERDTNELAKAMQKILDDPQKREDFGKNARSTVALWDNENMVLGFRQAIDYVTTKRK